MPPPQTLFTATSDTEQTLIVVFLRGGADGLALVPPVEDDHYHRARPRLGLKKNKVFKLDHQFGLHPGLRPLEAAWKEGALALVHACGIESPTRSHFEAQDLMEHAGITAGGWLGRFLRTRPDMAGALASVAIGKALPESLLGAPNTTVIESLTDFSLGKTQQPVREQLEKLYSMEAGQLGAAARDTFRAITRIEALSSENYSPAHGAVYPRDEFSSGLRQLAQLIKARVGLKAASMDLGGWDSHFTQESLLTPLTTRLASGLAAFRTDLGTLMDSVTVVVMTEFGRTVQENSAFGTDHGRGSVLWILGGGVHGGRFYGTWRGLDQLEPRGIQTDYADLPVLNNYRNALAPVLKRHGCAESDFKKIFPDFALSPLPLYG